MKNVVIAIATLVAACTQVYFIGLNGLTLISIPLTIYIGLLIMEKTDGAEEETINY